MDVHVREATGEDHATLVRFQIASARESEGLGLSQEEVASGVRAVLDDPAKGQYLVAEDESGVIGCVLIVREWSDWRNKQVLWLHSIYVVPEKRRRRVLTLMYDCVKSAVADASDLCGIRTLVDGRNGTGQAVAVRLGMVAGHYDTYEWLQDDHSNGNR